MKDKSLFNVCKIIICLVLIIISLVIKFTDSTKENIDAAQIDNNNEIVNEQDMILENSIDETFFTEERQQNLDMSLYTESDEEIGNDDLYISFTLKNDEEIYKEYAPIGFYKNLKIEIQKYINENYESSNQIKTVEVMSNSYEINKEDVKVSLLIDNDKIDVVYDKLDYTYKIGVK